MQQAAVIETTSFSSLTLEWELQLGNSERVLSVKEREREREREGERERERIPQKQSEIRFHKTYT